METHFLNEAQLQNSEEEQYVRSMAKTLGDKYRRAGGRVGLNTKNDYKQMKVNFSIPNNGGEIAFGYVDCSEGKIHYRCKQIKDLDAHGEEQRLYSLIDEMWADIKKQTKGIF